MPMNKATLAGGAAAIVILAGLGVYAMRGTDNAETQAASEWTSSGPVPNFGSGVTLWGLHCRKPDGTDCDTNTEFVKIPGDDGPGPVLQHPDYPYIHNENKRMADTNNPILQPWVKAKMDTEVARVIAGGFPFIPTSRCWPGGVPGIHLYTGSVAILQRPDQVWIIQQREGPRRVYMNVPHSEDPGLSWYGESVGRYENGDTLVVDTVGLDDLGPIDRLNTPHTEQLHVVERYQLLEEGKVLRVSFTVTDPGAYTQPWNAMVEYAPEIDEGAPAPWLEYVCNENSTEYFIDEGELVPVPSAARRDF
jgi:hypothetical protein